EQQVALVQDTHLAERTVLAVAVDEEAHRIAGQRKQVADQRQARHLGNGARRGNGGSGGHGGLLFVQGGAGENYLPALSQRTCRSCAARYRPMAKPKLVNRLSTK